MGKPPQTKKIKKLLTEAVTLLCRSSFSFADQVTVEGLLGITLDKRDILLISINETIKQTISRGVKAGRDFKSDESPSPKRKQSKKKRRRSTSSEGTEDSDEEQDMIGHVRDYNLPPGVIVGPDGQIHTTGQFHREAFHGEEPYGDSDTGQDDLEIKEEKLTDEEAECFMVEGEEEEDSKEGFIKGHPEMGYVQCGPAFSQAGPSNVHQFQGKGINQGQQPGRNAKNKCATCGKSFKDRQGLSVHVKRIHMPRKFCCPVCGQRFQQKFNLHRHLKSRHSDYVSAYGLENLHGFDSPCSENVSLSTLQIPSGHSSQQDDTHDLALVTSESNSICTVVLSEVTAMSTCSEGVSFSTGESQIGCKQRTETMPVFPVAEVVKEEDKV